MGGLLAQAKTSLKSLTAPHLGCIPGHFPKFHRDRHQESSARERSMVSKLHSHVGEKAVRAVMDQPSPTKPNKKKGGSLSLLPEKRKLVKTMAFLSIVEFVGSIFCASGGTQTNSADSTSKIPSARNSKRTVPEPHGLSSQEA